MIRERLVTWAALALVCAPGVALAGPDWVEIGDAGPSPRFAQVPTGLSPNSQLSFISGTLSGAADGADGNGDFEDMYYIRVNDPAAFSIRTGTANFPSALWLFNITVNFEAPGLLANTGEGPGSPQPRLVSVSNDGTGVKLTEPGDYLIAITGAGRVPVSRRGEIFSFASPFEVSGPDGPGGLNPFQNWSGATLSGSYTMALTGVQTPTVPAPASAMVLAVAALGLRRRR